jgi:hypothetical protein
LVGIAAGADVFFIRHFRSTVVLSLSDTYVIEGGSAKSSAFSLTLLMFHQSASRSAHQDAASSSPFSMPSRADNTAVPVSATV